ncbi:MAG: DNA polymerase III subunit chi [Methylococcales bacterium]|nr:DNA polymerase III subunit chi [Methylococcales bacterium]
MLKLTFYILSTDEARQRYFFCCQLLEKIYRQGYFCYVLTDSEHQSNTLNHLLWTFRQNSFIPHALYTGDAPSPDHKILIGSLPPPMEWQKIMVNFSEQPLLAFEQTERLLEIVDHEPERLRQGRQRYRYYKHQNLTIETIKR